MIFKTKDITEVTEHDLLSLVNNKVAESRVIEYKSRLEVRSDSEKKEFLADVSSFANTHGGHLFFGIEETDGVASNICGVDVTSSDDTILYLNNIIRDGVDPSLPEVTIYTISLKSGKSVVALQIPKSWASPHMVIFNKHRHFYGRHSAGKYVMDAHELRRAFSTSSDAIDQFNLFRGQRVEAIQDGEMPVPLTQDSKIILHVMPFGQNRMSSRFGFKNFEAKLKYFHFMQWSIGNYKIGYDGLIISSNNMNPSRCSNAYTMIDHNGRIESVEKLVGDDKQYFAKDYEEKLVELLVKLQNFYKSEKFEPPFVVYISITGLTGYTLSHPEISFTVSPKGFDRNNLLLPQVVVHSYSNDPKEYLKPIFDLIWNAAGWPESLSYRHGVWRY